jgi:hypothetical protein
MQLRFLQKKVARSEFQIRCMEFTSELSLADGDSG